MLFFAFVILLGSSAQWLAWRMKVPSILPLLVVGFLSGTIVREHIPLNEEVLFSVVSLAVAVIMLEGGLSLRFKELDQTGSLLAKLVSVGAAITWVLSAISLHYVAGFQWGVSIVIGAILMVTGPTVIGPLLRNVRPTRSVNALLKWEGIVIDPIGAIAAVLAFTAIYGAHGLAEDTGWMDIAFALLGTLAVGCALGYAGGKISQVVLARHWAPDYLQPIIVLALGLALFAISNLMFHESGLLTVTVMGVVLANQNRAQVRPVIEFQEHLRTLLISCLFIVLGGLVQTSELLGVWKEALILLALLIVVIRPTSVLLSSIGSKLSFRERLFICFLAPRGIVAAAVSAIFAIELSHQKNVLTEDTEKIVPLIFCLIFGTVAFYGLFSALIARKLGVATPNPQGILFAGITPVSQAIGLAVQELGHRVLFLDSNHALVSSARLSGLKAEAINAMSEYATEHLDFGGIGRFFAMTANDEVNALACMSLSHVVGRSNVYQIQPRTDEFTFDALLDQSEGTTVPVFVIRGRELIPYDPKSAAPKPGEQILSLTRDDKTP